MRGKISKMRVLFLAVFVTAALIATGELSLRPAEATADALTMSPISASLLPGESQTITFSGTNLTETDVNGVQIQIGHIPGEFSFSGEACLGDFSAGLVTPPAAQLTGTVFACALLSGFIDLSGVTEAIASIVVTRNAGTVGDRTLTLVSGVGFGTQFENAGIVVPADLTSSVSITGFNQPAAASTAGRQIDLSWTAPAGATPAVTGYRIVRNDNTNFVDIGVATSVSLFGVDTSAQTYSVLALNGSTSSPATTSATAAPRTVPAAPTTNAVTAEASGQVSFSWVAPVFQGEWTTSAAAVTTNPGTGPSLITDYRITGSSSGATTTGATIVTHTVTGLIDGTAENFTVAAINTVGTGAESNSAAGTPFGTPDAPTGVSAVGISQGARVTLVKAVNTGGVAVAGYFVTVRSGITTVATGTVAATDSTTQVDFTNGSILNGSTYTVDLATVNAGGNVTAGATSVASASSSLTAVGRPAAPAGLHIAAGNGSITASWNRVTTDASGNALLNAVSSYSVTSIPSGPNQPVVKNTGLTDAVQSVTLTGLTNGTSYQFNVFASNSDGNSDFATSTAATPESAALDSVTLGLNAFTISANGTHRFTATPLTASGGTPPNVTITFSVSGGGSIDANTGVYTAPDAAGTATVTVTASQSGTGASATDSVTVTVLAPPPAATPTPEPVNPPGPVPTPPPPDNVGGGTTVITPVEGGTVSTEDGSVSISIKPGSVTEFVAIDVSPIQAASVPEVPAALQMRVNTDGVVDITFKDADGNPIDNFVSNRAITVTVRFTDAEAADAGGANNLVIMKYDENVGAWSKLTTTVDLFNKTLSSQVKTFSLFAVGIPGVLVQPQPTATATATATVAQPTATATVVQPTATATVAAGLPTATPRTDVVLPATGDVAPGAGAIMGFIVLGLLFVTSGVAIVRRRQVARARS